MSGIDVANDGDGDDHAGTRRCGFATDKVGIVTLAAQPHSGVEFFKSLDGIAVADGHTHQHLLWCAIHGGDVAHGYGHGLVAQVP